MTSFLPQRNLVSVNQPSTSCYPEIKQNIFMNAPSRFVLIGILSLCWLSPRSCCIIVTGNLSLCPLRLSPSRSLIFAATSHGDSSSESIMAAAGWCLLEGSSCSIGKNTRQIYLAPWVLTIQTVLLQRHCVCSSRCNRFNYQAVFQVPPTWSRSSWSVQILKLLNRESVSEVR